VYFDDLSIKHVKSPVIQYNDYYAYGLQTGNSWTRDNTKNNFLYNEGSEQNPTSGNYDHFFRNYDPALARFVQVDPLASKYHSWSTYNYAYADPVYYTDPSGAGDDGGKKTTSAYNPDGMYGSSWGYETYGDGGPDGNWSAAGGAYSGSREGIGSGNGSFFHQQFVASIRARYETYDRQSTFLGLLTQAWNITGTDRGAVFNLYKGQIANWFTFEIDGAFKRASEIYTLAMLSISLQNFDSRKTCACLDGFTQGGGPTREAGGWAEADKLYDYLLNHAKNTSVEVAVYELKRGKEGTKYFVLPWDRNTKSSSVLPMKTLGKYIPGYSYKDINGVFHTHPRSTPPGIADMAYSDKYNIPIYSIGANGTSYLYLGGTTSAIDLSLYFGF
jgi:RHS repeat-associated protein